MPGQFEAPSQETPKKKAPKSVKPKSGHEEVTQIVPRPRDPVEEIEITEDVESEDAHSEDTMDLPAESAGSNAEHSKERHIETFECRDDEGELVCEVRLETSAKLTRLKWDLLDRTVEIRARKMRALVLTAHDEAGTREVDLLALNNPHGATVWVEDAFEPSNWLAVPGDEGLPSQAIVPKPGDAIAISVFLHELGHVKQYANKDFKPIQEIRRSEIPAMIPKTDVFGAQRAFAEYVSQLSVAVPNVARLTESADAIKASARADEFQELRSEEEELKSQVRELSRGTAEYERAQQRLRSVTAKKRILERSLREQLESDEVKALFNLPEVLMEEDATRDAIEVMETVKERFGIDLGRSLYADIEAYGVAAKALAKRVAERNILAEKGCEGVVHDLEEIQDGLAKTSSKEWLQAALDTYKTSHVIEKMRAVLNAEPELKRTSIETDEDKTQDL